MSICIDPSRDRSRCDMSTRCVNNTMQGIRVGLSKGKVVTSCSTGEHVGRGGICAAVATTCSAGLSVSSARIRVTTLTTRRIHGCRAGP